MDEVAHVYLHAGEEIINNTLVEKGYGEACEENYLSKVSAKNELLILSKTCMYVTLIQSISHNYQGKSCTPQITTNCGSMGF